MFTIENPYLWLIGVPAISVILFLLGSHFSAEKRERRRRGQSHRPVISRKHGPRVRLAVNEGKSERDRKR